MKHKTFISILIITILFSVLPYIIAAVSAGDGRVFDGFLLNPLDGNSYLAKMRLGWEGSWVFTLPYTADPGNGGYLFLFYIFLGQLSRVINLPLIWMFHLARVASTIILVITLYSFCRLCFQDNPKWIDRSFAWICLGAGLGWLVFPFGVVTSDLTVPEAFTFLSNFANPHFPLGLALLLLILMWSIREEVKYALYIFLAGLLLAVVLPFGVVIGLAVLAGLTAWQWIEDRKLRWKNLLAMLLGGGVFLFYQFWISTTDPVLAGWNAQNQTPSPALWDLLVSFSPALIFAVLILLRVRNWHPNYFQKAAVVWFACSLVLIIFPFSLQRRFLLGFSIPAVILAISAISFIWPSPKIQKRIFNALFAISLPSVVVLLLVTSFGIMTRDARLYLTSGEMNAFNWIGENTPKNAVILASPDTGNFIPAQTGRRVLYGHPFETVNAAEQKKVVIGLFEGTITAQAGTELLKVKNVSYVLYGPREKLLGMPSFLDQLKQVFSAGDVSIYSTN